MSASTLPEYPKSIDCSDGIIVSLSKISMTSAQIFVAVGRGASDGSMPITARASSNVTSGVQIVAAQDPELGASLWGVVLGRSFGGS